MTNPISEARADVATALGGIEGVSVFDFIPERMTAPAAIVTPGNPYALPGPTMGEFSIALNVRLFVKQGTNQVVSNALDDLIVSVCAALNEFGVSLVQTPGIDRETYGTPYLVADITINTSYKEAI